VKVSAGSDITPAQAAPLRWSARRPARAALIYVIAYLLLSAGGGELSKLSLRTIPLAAGTLLVATGILVLSLLLLLSLCRLEMRPGLEAAWVIGMMVVFALARPEVFAITGRWLGQPARGRQITELLLVSPKQQLFGNIALIVWAAFLGRLVSRVIREGKLLLPVAVVASIADIITVFWGVVAHLTSKAPELVEALSAQAPVAAPAALPLPILTSVGIGDFLFLAIFLAVALRHQMNAVKAMWATLVLVLIAPVTFLIWPRAPGMPGLPFISIGVLSANWRHLRFTREEKRALLFASVLVAVVIAWLVLRH
jgi:hypothetical protein